ncbi:hypothetical protein M0R19_03645 [Candidatus Pacearchaeota archaeon]|jgi:hypothetical protein|nr:hypothetical protein [Candidatus Pacearchaeota archaeon]
MLEKSKYHIDISLDHKIDTCSLTCKDKSCSHCEVWNLLFFSNDRKETKKNRAIESLI